MTEFKESNYGDLHIKEDPELTNDGWGSPDERPPDFQAFGPLTNTEELPVTDSDMLDQVEHAYSEVSGKFDQANRSMIENILSHIGKNYLSDRRWVKIMTRLMNDVLSPIKNGKNEFAKDNLFDINSEVQSMQH